MICDPSWGRPVARQPSTKISLPVAQVQRAHTIQYIVQECMHVAYDHPTCKNSTHSDNCSSDIARSSSLNLLFIKNSVKPLFGALSMCLLIFRRLVLVVVTSTIMIALTLFRKCRIFLNAVRRYRIGSCQSSRRGISRLEVRRLDC